MNKRSEQEQHEQVVAAAVEVLSLLGRSDQAILFDLGVAHQYHGAPEGVYYSAPYLEMGERLWRSIQSELQETLCTDGYPKQWVEGMISGDARDLIVGVITAMVSTLSVPLAIAIPATALVVKRGVAALCSDPTEQVPQDTAKEILDKHAAVMKKLEQKGPRQENG
jgi:hypothetical protein